MSFDTQRGYQVVREVRDQVESRPVAVQEALRVLALSLTMRAELRRFDRLMVYAYAPWWRRVLMRLRVL